MNHIHRGILNLIRSAVTGRAHPLPSDFQLSEAEDLIIKHQVIGLAYEGAVLCGIPKSDPIMVKLFQLYYQIIFRSNTQMAALQKLYAAFEEKGIDYLPVKGSVLKKLYPQPAMRSMGDADVLIRREQMDLIHPVMESLGYTEGKGDTHEWVWNSKQLHLELHTALVPDILPVEQQFFEDVWQRAVHVKGHCYALSCEEDYTFLFFHYVKHYRNGGIGLRQLLDLWIWQQKYPRIDNSQVEKNLDQMHLIPFYQNTLKMLSLWFDDAQPDEKSLFMSDYIFSSGSWGTKETHLTSSALRKAHETGSIRKGMGKTVSNILFPSVEYMLPQYPVLKKAPWLLPVFWVVRGFRTLLFRRQYIQRQWDDLQTASPEKIETFQQALVYVDLDYYL